jgi:hypothetical protein
MTRRPLLPALAALIVLIGAPGPSAQAPDISGTWMATFESQIGEQQYTFDFTVKGTELTGTAKGSLTGEAAISEGKVDGATVTFVENASYQDMPLRIVYTGKVTSAGEIAFTRNVADLVTEEITAKRSR